MGEVPNLYDTHQCPWFAKRKRFDEIQNVGDLVSVHILPLWIFIKIIWEQFCMIGKLQNDHYDLVLQTMQTYPGAKFGK